jgi:hypothetical protein
VKRQGIMVPCLFLLQFCCTKTYIMKKNLLVLITGAVLSFSAGAQFAKGDKVLGAGLSFQHSVNESNSGTSPYTGKSNNGSISLDLGFASRENRLSGFYISSGYGKSVNSYSTLPSFNNSQESFSIGAGFFSRRYQPIGKNFFLFAEGRAGADYGKQNNTNSSPGERTSLNIQAGLFPGISYKTGKHFLLDLRFADFVSLGYGHITDKGVGNSKTEQTNFGFSSSLGLGYLQNFGIGARWILTAGKK